MVVRKKFSATQADEVRARITTRQQGSIAPNPKLIIHRHGSPLPRILASFSESGFGGEGLGERGICRPQTAPINLMLACPRGTRPPRKPCPALPSPPQLQSRSLRSPKPDSSSSTTSSHSLLATPVYPVLNALTVDVEDYFQVSAFADRVCRKDWDKYECRVEANTDKLLSIFDEHQVRGTFFVLGWVAHRYPELVKRIVSAGHEIASHGYWHQLVYDLKPEEFAKDIADSKEAIAAACGIEVVAYRAPSFSIVEESLWALDILAEQGFRIDSSIFPIGGHDRYGLADAPKEIHDIETKHGKIIEFPPSAWSRGRIHIPIGGGYFRLFPLPLTLKAIEKVREHGRPAMFYTHPWEVDPTQPRIPGAKPRSRFRHYVGLKKTAPRISKMLSAHQFGTISDVIASSR